MSERALPFVVVRHGADCVPLFAGMYGEGTLAGIGVPDGTLYAYEPGDIVAAMSIDPAAVYWGLEAQWGQAAPQRMAADPAAADAVKVRYAPRGQRFEPALAMTGFPEATLLAHRNEIPSIDTIRLSSLFAISTVRTSIEEAERSFNCFVDLYEKAGRELPDVAAIRGCFRGLQNTKARMFSEVAGYAPVIQDAIMRGLRDHALRKYLVCETALPAGLGVAKMSFTLALLGHDCVCLDARLLVRMFGTRAKASEVEKGWSKSGSRVRELALRRYQNVEAAFLKGNPFYRAGDPIGQARAQWMSWESVGGAAAKHSVWLHVVTRGKPG